MLRPRQGICRDMIHHVPTNGSKTQQEAEGSGNEAEGCGNGVLEEGQPKFCSGVPTNTTSLLPAETTVRIFGLCFDDAGRQ